MFIKIGKMHLFCLDTVVADNKNIYLRMEWVRTVLGSNIMAMIWVGTKGGL